MEGLALSVLLSTMIRVITAVKMLWTDEVQPSDSTTNFEREGKRALRDTLTVIDKGRS